MRCLRQSTWLAARRPPLLRQGKHSGNPFLFHYPNTVSLRHAPTHVDQDVEGWSNRPDSRRAVSILGRNRPGHDGGTDAKRMSSFCFGRHAPLPSGRPDLPGLRTRRGGPLHALGAKDLEPGRDARWRTADVRIRTLGPRSNVPKRPLPPLKEFAHTWHRR